MKRSDKFLIGSLIAFFLGIAVSFFAMFQGALIAGAGAFVFMLTLITEGMDDEL